MSDDPNRHAAAMQTLVSLLHNHFQTAVGVAVLIKFDDGKVGGFSDMDRKEMVKTLRTWLREELTGKKRIITVADKSRMKN